MKKYLVIGFLCLLLAACAKPAAIPEGYYSGPAEEGEAETMSTPDFFVERQDGGEATYYSIFRRNTDGSIAEIADLGPNNDTPFFLWQNRIYYTAGGSLCSVDFDGKDLQTLSDLSEAQVSFDRITMVEDGWIYCRGTRWQQITDDPAALPGPHRVKTVTRAKANLDSFEILE